MFFPSNISTLEQFARSLLTIVDETIVIGGVMVDGPVVNDFNGGLFCDKCQTSKPNYNPDLANFDELATHVLKQGVYWKNKSLLRKVLDIFGSVQGWTYVDDCVSLCCNRFGMMEDRGKKPR